MNARTKILLATAASTVAIAGGTVTKSFAQSATASPKDVGMSSLVDTLATRFNLNKDDVQKVFDEERANHQAEHQKKQAERLDQAVADGKITSAQKDLIIAKQAEIKAKMGEIMKITDETARKTALNALHMDLEKWTTDNNIDQRYVGPMGMKGGRGGGRDGGPSRMSKMAPPANTGATN